MKTPLWYRWVTDWPGQVVIAVDCMYWTKEAVDAILKSALSEYATQCTEDLMKVGTRVYFKVQAGNGGNLSRFVGDRHQRLSNYCHVWREIYLDISPQNRNALLRHETVLLF